MSIVASLALSVLVVGAVAVVLLVVRVVGADGYGHRVPSSHDAWQAGALPSRPYREG